MFNTTISDSPKKTVVHFTQTSSPHPSGHQCIHRSNAPHVRPKRFFARSHKWKHNWIEKATKGPVMRWIDWPRFINAVLYSMVTNAESFSIGNNRPKPNPNNYNFGKARRPDQLFRTLRQSRDCQLWARSRQTIELSEMTHTPAEAEAAAASMGRIECPQRWSRKRKPRWPRRRRWQRKGMFWWAARQEIIPQWQMHTLPTSRTPSTGSVDPHSVKWKRKLRGWPAPTTPT